MGYGYAPGSRSRTLGLEWLDFCSPRIPCMGGTSALAFTALGKRGQSVVDESRDVDF
jgi:hypothetical protein